MFSLLATKLYGAMNELLDSIKVKTNLGMKLVNSVIENWVASEFIKTFSVAVKFYVQPFLAAAFVMVYPILRTSKPFFSSVVELME